MAIRHKCFVSHHHADQAEVREFIDTFDAGHDVFISRDLTMPEDVVNSNDDDYVMGRIRQLYIRDSTVTIVLVGACTWSRQFVDWETQASLRQAANGLPNGLLAILLNKGATQGKLPSRVRLNFESTYARFQSYPPGPTALAGWIDEAYNARTALASRIVNPRSRQQGNLPCL